MAEAGDLAKSRFIAIFVAILSHGFLMIQVRVGVDGLVIKKSEIVGPKIRKYRKFLDEFGMVWECFGGAWGHFRTDFGPTLKNRKFESSELKF